MEISLTDFIDFLVTVGKPRLTKVRNLKTRPAYKPHFDHWKDMRDAIIAFHGDATQEKGPYFDRFLRLADESKKESYTPVVTNYKRFLAKKSFAHEDLLWSVWEHRQLRVRINPELHEMIDGRRHVGKLYFKAEPLSKNRVDLILLLMRLALPAPQGPTMYLLYDARHNKVYATETPDITLTPLLDGEADSFITIWNSV
jgi:hypothetical protein